LPKLNNTKDRENKSTLLYFLVEHIEKDYPELITFADEMFHIDSASRVNIENIQKLLKQMDNSIKALDMDLKNNAKAAPERDDRFAQAMGEFCGEARAECDVLNGMFKNLESLYSELEKFYVFDKQKYNLEEFMSDIKTFIKQFKDAYTQMMKEREADEKLIRVREAREKQEKERAERAEKKRALVDFNAPDNQEGVMDSLLEALKTGTAFNRDQKRKRPPRAAGAERRAQLNRSRSRGPNGHGSPNGRFDIVDIITDNATTNQFTNKPNHHNAENDPMMAMLASDNSAARRPRPGRSRGANTASATSRERELPSGSANTKSTEEGDALLRKLRAL
jgi:diaphanous 2